MKTRAAVITEMEKPRPYATSRPLVIEELDLDPPGEGEILVRIRAAGLCHSDLSTINGDRPRQMPHGARPRGGRRGDGAGRRRQGPQGRRPRHPRVRAELRRTACRAWKAGRRCASREPKRTAPARCCPARRGSQRNGKPVLPSRRRVGLRRVCRRLAPARRSRSIARLPFEEAALFGCAVITGAGAVINTAKVPPERRVAVVGLGGVGLMSHAGGRAIGLPADRRRRHARRQARARQAARRHAHRQRARIPSASSR